MLHQNLFYYDSSENDYSKTQMSAVIPEKLIIGSQEQIKFVHENWEKLLANKIPALYTDDKNWYIDSIEEIKKSIKKLCGKYFWIGWLSCFIGWLIGDFIYYLITSPFFSVSFICLYNHSNSSYN